MELVIFILLGKTATETFLIGAYTHSELVENAINNNKEKWRYETYETIIVKANSELEEHYNGKDE